MARELNVWMNGELVGTWSQPRGTSHIFRYDESWPRSPRSRPLSLSIPITSDLTVRGAVVENFFDNLLPDNDAIRRRLQGRFKTNSTQAIELLTAIGRDCVGAVQLLPPDTKPEGIESIKAKPLKEAEMAQWLRDVVTPSGSMAGHDPGAFRISIAGAQEKTALLWHDGQWCQPQGATPTTHIFKLPLGIIGGLDLDMRDSIENEWLCLKILAALDLPVAHAEMASFEDQRALVVTRFDRELIVGRTKKSSWIARLPQEDFCQAMGLPPRSKYEADGGPGIDRCLELLHGSSASGNDRISFLLTQLVFWLLAATDGHGKNFSIFLNQGHSFRMTPLYDVLSVWPVIGKGRGKLPIQKAQLAMALRGENVHRHLREIQARHWRLLFEKVIRGEWDAVVAFVESAPDKVDRVLADLPLGFPSHVADTLREGIRSQVCAFVRGAWTAASP
jgi:serine/threonine-protein kinase HipA